MDQGIIQHLKILYCKKIIVLMTKVVFFDKLDIILCECVLKYGKIENINENTIVNCFIKSGICVKGKEIKNTHLEGDDRGTIRKLK